MNECRVVTNNHTRRFLYGYEVPKHVRDDYEHLDHAEALDGWIAYRNRWYHESDFILTPTDSPLRAAGWDAYLSDSYFSGVVFTPVDAHGGYRIGTYLC